MQESTETKPFEVSGFFLLSNVKIKGANVMKILSVNKTKTIKLAMKTCLLAL